MNFSYKKLLNDRISTTVFTGLPLTVLVIVCLILLSTFVGITEQVVTSAPITKIDVAFSNFLYHLRTPALAQLFFAITWVANQLTIIVLGALSLLYLYIKKERDYLYSLALIFLGSETSVYFIKIFINRPRPLADIAYYVETSRSFPSGHASIAIAFYGFTTYYMIRHVYKNNNKSIVIFIGTTLITLIGFSRIYLGVHFLSDVLGGFLIGGLWLVMGITFREMHFYTRSLKK